MNQLDRYDEAGVIQAVGLQKTQRTGNLNGQQTHVGRPCVTIRTEATYNRTWKQYLGSRFGLCSSAIADDFIVTPRACSSSRESMYRAFPASLDEMIPFDDTNESASVVLPAQKNMG